MTKTKILICGATGFIGHNLIERFAARDDVEVHGTYLKTPPPEALQTNPKLKLHQMDLTNKDQVNAIVAGMDFVIQAAAVTSGSKDIVSRPYIHTTDNAVMNSLLFRACFDHHIKHVVFFSCTTMYSPQPEPVREDDFNGEIIPKYFGVGWTKVYLEKMCEFYSRIGSARYTTIRHSNIYGPYDKYDLERSHVFGATVTKVMSNTDGVINVWGDGSEARDLLYVSDLVDFVELALANQKTAFELLNLGTGQAVPIRDLVQKIIAHSGKPLTVRFDTTKPTINFNIELDVTKAKQKFDWAPKVSLDEGIGQTLAWYRRTYPNGIPH